MFDSCFRSFWDVVLGWLMKKLVQDGRWNKILSFICFFVVSRKPDIHVPYLYVDMGAAVLCASFMSFGVKRRWFAMAAAIQLAVSTYASYIGEQVHYGDWLKVSHRLCFFIREIDCSRSSQPWTVSPCRYGCIPERWPSSEASWFWPAGRARCTDRKLAADLCSLLDKFSWESTSSAWWDL